MKTDRCLFKTSALHPSRPGGPSQLRVRKGQVSRKERDAEQGLVRFPPSRSLADCFEPELMIIRVDEVSRGTSLALWPLTTLASLIKHEEPERSTQRMNRRDKTLR
jgi:hypothetical protein